MNEERQGKSKKSIEDSSKITFYSLIIIGLTILGMIIF